MKPAKSADIISIAVSKYEADHAVEKYEAYGWLVWPYLKGIVLGDNLFLEKRSFRNAVQPCPNKTSRTLRNVEPLHLYFSAFNSYLKWSYKKFKINGDRHFEQCDVLFLGSGKRYQQVGSDLVHYPTEPLIEEFRDLGFKCNSWHWDPPTRYPARKAADVRPPFRWTVLTTLLLRLLRKPAEEPWWFAEFSAFHSTLSSSSLSWKSLAPHFYEIAIISNLAEKWLKISKPRLVLLDWWLNGPMIATSLAAHRLGIPTMDLQHGIQEYDSEAYHGWIKEPVHGWPGRPRLFWVWGEEARGRAMTKNRIQQTVIAGGNLWLNHWVEGKSASIRQACFPLEHHKREAGLVVLLTLQGPEIDNFGFLQELIKIAPTAWRWLVRCHPRMHEDVEKIADRLGGAAGQDVHVHTVEQHSLYALLRTVNVHVTNYSTCANEAMAFGVPSVLFGEIAPTVFQWGLSSGAMFHAVTPTETVCKIEEARRCHRESIIKAARRLFAGSGDTKRAMTQLISILGERNWNSISTALNRKTLSETDGEKSLYTGARDLL